ncbi:MAG: lytic murein transglycosylase [Deltaproteobacteria bacterium]|nr:lytic murein transglycosylase [Deltaproteobacteria bacterium]
MKRFLKLAAVFAAVFVQQAVLSVPTAIAKSPASEVAPLPLNSFLERKLRREKFKPAFIRQMLRAYEPRDFHSVLELNVLLYLRKSDYHGPQVSDEAVTEVRDFQQAQAKWLRLAESRYGVDQNAVASLLWIESRLGKNVGNFHVPSVYLHLIQAPRVSVQNYLLSRTEKFTDSVSEADQKEIVARTHKKAKWALDELRALQKVHAWKWKVDEDLRGSFSGAFGIPQFLPSSYVRWARSRKKSTQPVLSRPEDAIFSVGFYLMDHGWKKSSREAQLAALYKYNNSHDYAAAILSLADRVKEEAELKESKQTR